MALGDPAGRRRLPGDHRLGERGVVLHRAGADRPAVRLGAEAQADLPADLAAQAREVGVAVAFAIAAWTAWSAARDASRSSPASTYLLSASRIAACVRGRDPRRRRAGDQRLDQLPEVQQALEVRPLRQQRPPDHLVRFRPHALQDEGASGPAASHIDVPERGQPLDRLADRRATDPERRRQLALGG
jgi:hypothetical protein